MLIISMYHRGPTFLIPHTPESFLLQYYENTGNISGFKNTFEACPEPPSVLTLVR